MRKCQRYQDLSGKNRRDDRAQKEAFADEKELIDESTLGRIIH